MPTTLHLYRDHESLKGVVASDSVEVFRGSAREALEKAQANARKEGAYYEIFGIAALHCIKTLELRSVITEITRQINELTSATGKWGFEQVRSPEEVTAGDVAGPHLMQLSNLRDVLTKGNHESEQND